MFVLILYLIVIIPVQSEVSLSKPHQPSYWKAVENIAERYPYVVGIVDVRKFYKCTGTVISKDAVLTSGSCLKQNPVFVVAAAAVIRHGCKNMGAGGILEIVHTVLHRDFIFQLEADDPFRTQIHSNIGIAIVERPVLDLFFKSAEIGNFYATELREKQLTSVGYGKIDHINTLALQEQDYRQTPCKNPKWYYCVCGLEVDSEKKYVSPFGEGGPLIFGSQVVAVANTPCGALEMPENQVKVFVRTMSQKQWAPLKEVGIIGVPFEKGQKKYGVSVAPAALRSAGLLDELRAIDGLDVQDYGDVDIPSCGASLETSAVDNMAHLPLVSACNRALSARVARVLGDGRVAVTIGGDHSIGVGTVDGHYAVNKDMILIWVDAHADINTNKTSDSGSVHGMPVALLVKELADYWPYLPTMDWQVPKFSIKNLGYLGLRSVDNYERLAIEKYNVPAFAMEDVEAYGIEKSIHHILRALDPCNDKPIHVSFDIDSLDALEAPSTGTPVRGGLTLREAISLMEIIHSTGRLRAIDLVEINPAIGNDSDRKRTIEAGLCVLKAALGFSRRGTAPRGVRDLPVQTPPPKDKQG